ncbi:MAG: DinB family protein [Acidobacteriota bacterium]
MQSLREHIVYALEGEGAHAGFYDATNRLDPALQGKRPEGAAHSPWELLEHMRLAQSDILRFTRNDPDYAPLDFPDGYWPRTQAPPDGEAWERSVVAFRTDLSEFAKLVTDESKDLLAPLPQSKSGASIMAQALLVADHNSYHLGQLVMLRRLLGAWE